MYRTPLACAAFLLSACTTDPLPEEEYEAPTGNFPLLGTVPDRPTLPSSEDITQQQKRLQGEHDQATKKQVEILKSTKA
jgi:hypothetical protein